MNTQLSLSTATPSLGGAPPKLMTLKIGYYYPRSPIDDDLFMVTGSVHRLKGLALEMDSCMALQSCSIDGIGVEKKPRRAPSFRERTSLSSKNTAEEDHSHKTNVVNVLSTTAEAGMSSTSFAIPRRSTIDADVSVHSSTHRDILFSLFLSNRANHTK